MLKTLDEILGMLREQEAALNAAIIDRAERDKAMVKVIEEESSDTQRQLNNMRHNVALAIIKLEGSEGVGHVQD